MLPILAIISLAFGQAERPPKLDFKEKIDYAAWINAQMTSSGSQTVKTLYRDLLPTPDGNGGFQGGIPEMGERANGQYSDLHNVWSESEFPELASYIQKNRKHLDAVLRAATEGKCWDPIPLDEDFVSTGLTPFAQASRSAYRALIARAWMKQPNQAKAINETHIKLLGLANQLHQSGLAISALVGLSIRSGVSKSVLRALDMSLIDESNVAQSYDDLFKANPGSPQWDALVTTEWAAVLSFVQHACPKGEPDPERLEKAWAATGKGRPPTPEELEVISAADPLNAPDLLDGYYQELRSKGLGSLRWGKAAQIKEITQEFRENTGVNIVIWLYFSDLTRTYELLVRTESEYRGTMLALAIHAHHAKHGEWPADLGKIDPKLGLKNLKAYRIDPMTGKRFIYHVKHGKPWLYSAGADGDDDGGAHHPKFGEHGAGGDYVFWPRPSR